MIFRKILPIIGLLTLSASVFAGTMGKINPFKAHLLAEIGGYSALQGKAQNIYIAENLVGNRYTVSAHNQGSGLVGLGLILDAPQYSPRFDLSYGANVFFLGQTSVRGFIVEEQTFTNLAYDYKLRHIPLYFMLRTAAKTRWDTLKLAVDLGVGPNFMSVSRYRETPLNTFTLTDINFKDRSNVEVAATAGVGLRFNDREGQIPLECGYRFFYLGRGHFKVNNDQLINTLSTGNNYANAFVCSVII